VQANPDNGGYCYYVIAVEGGNPGGIVNNRGQPMQAVSNKACSFQQARVFTATAFRPSSPVLENRSFGPSIRLSDVSNYQLQIVNRWGKTVFETTDPTERWDGTYENQDAPQGTYIYFVKYSTPGEKRTEEKGTFSLIR
jgi:gliding motility-associated-like protein